MYNTAIKEVKIVDMPIGCSSEVTPENELNLHLASGWSLLTILTDRKLQAAGDGQLVPVTHHTVTYHYAVIGR